MSKKSRRRRQKPRKRPAPARFATGIQVRVKTGTTDPDFPDIPLGGWSGMVLEVNHRSNRTTYLIEWDQRTLEHMHPIYRKRCERDGLGLESMWLAEDDIEPDTGEPIPIEQPTPIITRPLKMSDQDDRIRAILGLTSDDSLPEVDEENLCKYHEYLTRHFTFPFQASYQEAIGPWQYQRCQITVRALPDRFDVEDGLLCEALEQDQKIELALASLEGISGGSNRQLVDDYCYWFWNWQGEGNAIRVIEEALLPNGVEEDPYDKPAILRWFALAIAKLGLLGGFYGAILGAALASLEGASVAATIGAVLLAAVVGWLGAKYGPLFGAMNRNPYRNWFGGLIGLIVGGLLGALLGVMLVAFIGALAGAILGGIVARYLGSAKTRQDRTMLGALAGAMLGVGAQSWMRSAEDAFSGTWIGGVTGAITGPTLFFVVIVILVILASNRERR
jgi:hypothetical protein